MTAEDVRSVSFEQVRKGYKPEDVDDFLNQVSTDLSRIEAERDTAIAEKAAIAAAHNALIAERDGAINAKEDAEAKMYVLAAKVEEYRGQEETLKTALINAQRMGETVVYEAKQKADTMLRDATNRADTLRQGAEDDSERERQTLENLQNEVKNFKTTILNLYKQHIESLSALDPPLARAEDALMEHPQRTQPTENEEAMSVAWNEQQRTNLSIEIPSPPRENFERETAASFKFQEIADVQDKEYDEELSSLTELSCGSEEPKQAPEEHTLVQKSIIQPLNPLQPIQPLASSQPSFSAYEAGPYNNLP